ncbi:MAG: hypothetical protein L0220_00960 [Acidobacteria bacterium]|nr:hypothetical protein [Acidobacteriota bacterium]
MQRRKIGLVLLITALGLIGFLSVQAQRKYSTSKGQKPAGADQIQPITSLDYKVSGPYSHKNLSIFLIHGEDRAKERVPLTLQEAMEQKKVIVHETDDVNSLAIENVSQEEVFVQSGDIVKGGKQDRVLALDLIVPPKSGKLPIDSFCVEQGRWSKRGDESANAFSASDKMLITKDLKIAAKSKKSQSEVWENVAKSTRKVSEGVLAYIAPAPAATPNPLAPPPPAKPVAPGTADNAAAIEQIYANSLRPHGATSSLQLALENKEIQQTVSDYLKNLSSIIEGKNDVIGYAFAINGQVNSGDVYSSHRLFKKLWPKLLESSATEALGEFQKDVTFEPLDVNAVKSFMNEAETGKDETKEVAKNVTMIKRESKKNLFFETRDRKQSAEWIHRNYISK